MGGGNFYLAQGHELFPYFQEYFACILALLRGTYVAYPLHISMFVAPSVVEMFD